MHPIIFKKNNYLLFKIYIIIKKQSFLKGWGCSIVDSAVGFGPTGRGFKSHQPLFYYRTMDKKYILIALINYAN